MSNERQKIRNAVSGAKSRVASKLSDLWWWLMIRGVLALGLGLFALFWPQRSIGLLVSLLGGFLLLDGLLGVVGAFRNREKDGAVMVAILGLALGAALLFWTDLSVRLFLVLVGVWALIQGIGMFLSSRNQDSEPESRKLVGSLGGALAIAGLVLALWPNTGVVAISWMIAIVALLLGCLLIYAGTRLQRIAGRINS